MSQSRHALLLAIAEYDSCPELDYVRRDVPRMRQALDRMGVPACNIKSDRADGDQPQRDLTTNRIKKLIRDFVNGAEPDTDLIVYISCHGAEIGNHRVLIPQDFDPADVNPSELISDIDLLAMARRSKAASVLFLIDACRDSYRLKLEDDTKALGSIGPLADSSPSNDSPTIAIVFSCAFGQRSGKVRDTGECSAFTKAFAEALESTEGGNELADVIALAQPFLTRYQSTDQTISLGDQRAHGRRGDPGRLVVKQGPDAAFLDRLEHSPWVGRLRKLGMWQEVNEAAPGFAMQVAVIVLRAEDAVRDADKVLPRRHWRTDEVPFRMLDRIAGHLFNPMGAKLAEIALLLAVPFVYEFVLATAATRLAAEGSLLDPLSSEDHKDTSAFWRAWQAACDNDDAGERHVKRLKERGKPEQADDYATWRLIAFCHRAGELWDAGQHGWIVRDVAAAIAPASLRDVQSDRRVGECLTKERLLRFTRLMFAEFEDILLEASGRIGASLNRDERFGDGTGELSLDELTVVHQLNLGARLALDARRLPPLLAEHLGCDGTLTLELVQEKLQATAWHTRETTLSLRLACPHEALDAALREAVEDLEAHLRRLRAADLIHQGALLSLPATVTARDLTPFSLDGKSPYDTEHLRFTLDQGRIMGLLMGKELYGDPDLALRELYQNALDACRYRRAHEAWRRKQAGEASYGRDYEGLIVFRFGSENGRRYIECHDNGIGMGDRHLRRLFACAGQRFTDSHEYHLDKARWEMVNIPFYPNSRFGIGVLSYFMLAEELEVESQRVSRPGEQANELIHARVLGSGSLFRLDRSSTGAVHDGGTRVRLWLEDTSRPSTEY